MFTQLSKRITTANYINTAFTSNKYNVITRQFPDIFKEGTQVSKTYLASQASVLRNRVLVQIRRRDNDNYNPESVWTLDSWINALEECNGVEFPMTVFTRARLHLKFLLNPSYRTFKYADQTKPKIEYIGKIRVLAMDLFKDEIIYEFVTYSEDRTQELSETVVCNYELYLDILQRYGQMRVRI